MATTEKARRSTGTATITFGMVVIPAKLYAATESKDAVSFHLLHKCGSRLKQQYVCQNDGQIVERDDMVKGYEVAKDRYITFTPDELKAFAAESTEAIEITEFVPAGSVDPIFFEKASYLAPEKAGAQAFGLLRAAMVRGGREAIGKYAARGKQYVVLLRPAAGALIVHTLRYAGAGREPIEGPAAPAADALFALAQKIDEDLGGYEKFKADFIQAGVGQFGSGWAWLAVKDGKLAILKTPNGENPLVHGSTPILGVDVWEHSYYIDYRNRRPDYLKAFIENLVNWEYVEKLYGEAKA